ATLADHAFTTSAALDLLPDGSDATVADPHPEGPLVRGTLVKLWRRDSYRLPVHPATLCIRRERLLQLGGWMALPASEDTGLLIAASVVSRGYFIPEAGLLYRKWPGQATAQADHTDPEEWISRMRIIEQRARYLRDGWGAL